MGGTCESGLWKSPAGAAAFVLVKGWIGDAGERVIIRMDDV